MAGMTVITGQAPMLLQHLSRAICIAHARSVLSQCALRQYSAAAAPAGQSAAIIKQLRERSGAPIADVKNMLVEHGWDVDKAYEALRKKGLAAAAKKASRHASEGLVGASFATSGATSSGAASASGGRGSVVVVELNSETDFVARNSLFQGLLREVMAAAHAMTPPPAVGADHQIDMEQLLQARTSSGVSVSEAVTGVAAQVRENVRLRRAYRVDSGDGLAYSYVHQAATPGIGKLASVVVLQPQGEGKPPQGAADSEDALRAVGEGLAMQVAGMRPLYLNRAAVPADVLARERTLLAQQLEQDSAFKGKPQQVLSKVVEGRLSKQLADWCLLEQRYVLDEGLTVGQLLKKLQNQIGRPMQAASFLRVQCGEGLGPKGGDDFAAEVAKIVGEL